MPVAFGRSFGTVESQMSSSKHRFCPKSSSFGSCRVLLLVVAAVCFGGLAEARAQSPAKVPAKETGSELVSTEVFASVGIVTPGTPFELAIKYTMKPDWHIYWRNAGGSGMPPEMKIVIPKGYTLGPTRWPTPEVFPGAEPSYGYSKEVVLLVPITPPPKLHTGNLKIKFALDWLVCRKACLFGSREHVLQIRTNSGPMVAPITSARRSLLATWRARMPKPIQTVVGASARVDGERLILEGPLGGTAESVWFYPDDTPGVLPAKPGPIRGRIEGDRFRIDVPLVIQPENALGEPLRAAGLIVARSPDSSSIMPSISFEIPIPTSESSSSGVTTPGTHAPADGG